MEWKGIENSAFYKNFTVQIPKAKIWAPEIAVWNSADEIEIIKFANDSLLKVSPEGFISIEVSKVLQTNCDLDVKKYKLQL